MRILRGLGQSVNSITSHRNFIHNTNETRGLQTLVSLFVVTPAIFHHGNRVTMYHTQLHNAPQKKGNTMDELELMDAEEREEEATEEAQHCEFKFAWIALLDSDREARD